MDAQFAQQAGPEWAYCAALAQQNSMRVNLDRLFINVWHHVRPNLPNIDLILLLDDSNVAHVTDPVLRYSFASFRDQYLGQDNNNFRVFFQAFHGASYLEIRDERSFRRLLMAIQTMGLPIPEGVSKDDDNLKFVPPALRFVFGPHNFKPNAEPPRVPSQNVPEADVAPVVSSSPYRSNLYAEELEDLEPGMQQPASQAPPRSGGGDDGATAHDGQGVAGDDENGHDDSDEALGDQSLLIEPDHPNEELAIEQRVKQVYNFGLTNDRSGIHKIEWHNLYADVAGISRNNCDSSKQEHQYQPPYSRISLPPYQTYPVGWIFGNRQRVLHYLADWPGLGKTYTAIEAMVRIMMIISLDVQIKEERRNLRASKDPPVHVHRHNHPDHGRNEQCQADTQRLYGVVCPCSPDSPTNALSSEAAFGKGYMLVIVPAGLTDQWVGAIDDFLKPGVVLPHNQQPIEVVDIGDSFAREKLALEEFLFRTRDHNGLGSICVAANTTLSRSYHALNQKDREPLTQQPCMIVCDEAHNMKGKNNNEPQLVNILVNDAPDPVHVLAISGSPCGISGTVPDFSVIESISKVSSLTHWYDNLKEYDDQLKGARGQLDARADEIRMSIPISNCKRRIPISEEDKAEAVDVVARYDQAGRRYASVLPLLQRRALDDYLGFPIPRLAPKPEPAETRTSNGVMDRHQRAIGNKFKEFLVSLVPNRVKQWEKQRQLTRAPYPPTFATDLFTLETEAHINAYRGTYDKSRLDMTLAAFAPGLAEQILALSGTRRGTNIAKYRVKEVNNILKGTLTASQRPVVKRAFSVNQAFDAFGWDPTTQRSLRSPKINSICEIIDQMLVDNEMHQGRDPNLGPLTKKAIICVLYPWQAYILIAFLFYRYPARNFTYVGSAFSKKERAVLLEPFRRQTLQDDQRERDPDDPIALIGTYSALAEGLDLTRCNYAICTSPLGSDTFELQLFSRIHRRGQFCKTHMTTLVDHGDPSDVILYHRMHGRTPDTVPDDEKGRGLQFLLDEDLGDDEEQEVQEQQEGHEDDGDMMDLVDE